MILNNIIISKRLLRFISFYCGLVLFTIPLLALLTPWPIMGPGSVFGADESVQPIELTDEDLNSIQKTSKPMPGLQDSIVVLNKSYRFSAHSDIGKLSRHVKRGDPDKALKLLKRSC